MTATRDPDAPGSRARSVGGRGGGVVVVVLVLVAAMAMPNILAGRRVAGLPIAMDFETPPRAGQCVQAPLPLSGTGGLAVEISFTDVVVGDCGPLGARGGGSVGAGIGGEVVAWVPQRGADEEPGPNRRLRGPCFQQAAEYAGLTVSGRRVGVPGGPDSDVVRWSPTIGFDTHRIVPGPAEQQAGRTWFACVAVPINHDPYTGSLAGAFAAGRLPDSFGMCWDGTDLDSLARVLPCAQPHSAELLATGWVPNRSVTTQAELQMTCEQVAAALLRRADPTAGGALSVVLDPITGDGATNPNDPQSVGCFVATTGTARLVGTLVGLGEGPLPLAN